MAHIEQPCGWVADHSCGDCTAYDALPEPVRDTLDGVAAEWLWQLTGRQYGECTVTVRPCGDDCTIHGKPFPVRAAVGTGWTNVACGCLGACGCGRLSQVWLEGPVTEIVEVLVDGAAVPSGDYRVDEHVWLVRQDGSRWPVCQSLGEPAPGGLQVTYLQGWPLPTQGQIAQGTLACELAKACAGDKNCRIPKTATAVSRQGVTVTLPAVSELIELGRTGIVEVDMWIAAAQPRPSSRLLPRSPDVPTPRMQTWP